MYQPGRGSRSRAVHRWFASRLRSFVVASLILLTTILFAGCALSRAAAGKQPVVDVSGVWEGASKVTPCSFTQAESVCNTINRITLALVQKESEITGSYRCDYGNYICRDGDLDRAGYISIGAIDGRRVSIRVMIPADVSSCMFYGRFGAQRAIGSYSCYEGGGLVEQGIWEAALLY
jgi:hypothetical protein